MVEFAQPEVELLVNARRYGGWKDQRITRSIETISGSFNLSVTEKWSENSKPWEIYEGDSCSVLLDGESVIDGFVDDVNLSFSGDDHAVGIEGRDTTREVVDCSSDLGKWEFRKILVLSFLQQVASQFDISVSLGPGVVLPAIPENKISINPGDTAFSTIDRVAKFAGLLPVADGSGGIILIQPGKTIAPVTLKQGVNFKQGSAKYSQKDRFSKYVVLAQQQGGKGSAGSAGTQVRGEYIDQDVSNPNRVTVMQSETAANKQQADARAKWEGIVRAARAGTITADVAAWRPVSNYIWTPGDLIPVRAPALRINGMMMIATVNLIANSQDGKPASLTLVRPDAFSPLPQSEREWQE